MTPPDKMRPEWIQVEVLDTRHWFFVVIGLDQAIHLTCLVVTMGWLSRG